jgi:hypothetical protein
MRIPVALRHFSRPVRPGLWTLFALLSAPAGTFAADTHPAQYTDDEFWKLINDFSEPNGVYEYENFVSNEVSYQNVLPELKRITPPGGVYLGVGPEQNCTCVAALRPKQESPHGPAPRRAT